MMMPGQGRSQYEANRGTCLSHFFRFLSHFFNTLNTWEENLTMDIASVRIFFLATALQGIIQNLRTIALIV